MARKMQSPSETIVNRRTIIKSGAAAALAGIAGCSESDEETQTTATDTKTDTNEDNSSPSEEGMDLTAWAFGPHADALQAIAKEWDSKHSIEAKKVKGISDRLISALQSQSNLPSISLVRGHFHRSVSESGGFAQLGEVADSDDLFLQAKSLSTVNGDYFAFPNDLAPIVMIYNSDVFDQAGLPTNPDDVEQEIETWQDWMNAAETVKSETGAHMGALDPSKGSAYISAMLLQQYGGYFYNDDGEFAYNQPANVKGFELGQKLLEHTTKGFVRSGDTQPKFRNGEIAVHFAPAWSMGLVMPSTFPDMDSLRVAQPPMAEDGLQLRVGNWAGSLAAIPAALEQDEHEAAVEFGKFWNLSETGFNKKIEAGLFPAVDLPDAAGAHKEEEFYGGHKVWQKAMKVCRNGPPIFSPPVPEIAHLAADARAEALSTDGSVQDVLDNYQEQMLAKMDEDDKTVDIDQFK